MLAAFLAVTLLPLCIIVTLNYRSSTAALTEAAYRSLYAAASQAAFAVDAFINMNLDDISGDAKLPALSEYLEFPADRRARTIEKERILKTLSAIGGKSRNFPVSYALLDLNGRNLADTDPSNIGKTSGDRSYFRRALETGLPYCSSIEFSPSDGKAYLYFSSRILNKAGKPVGVLRSRYDAQVLQTLLAGTSGLLGSESVVVLLDENYLRLAHGTSSDLLYKTVVPLSAGRISELQKSRRLPLPGPDRLSTDLPMFAAGLQKAGSHEPYFNTPIVSAGMKMNAGAVAKVNSMPWLVAFMQPLDVFLKPVKAQTTKTIYFGLLIIIAVALLAAGISELLSEPISLLTAAAQKVADGDLTAQAFVKTHDEIGALATAFNLMTTKLRKRDASLAEEKERLAVTLRSIGDGVITTDVEGRVLLMNKVAEHLTGWQQDEAHGRLLSDVFKIVGHNTREACENPFDTVMRSQGIVELQDHTILVSKDGREMTIADSGAPILDKESRVVGVVLVFRDVTEKEKAEEEFIKAEKLESLGILAGGIAHDFNNILTSVIGNISLAKIYSPDGKIAQRLSDAERAALRAKDLTQQLLTFSKGGAPIKGVASVSEIIRDSAHFALRGSNVKCNFHMASDLRTIEVDEGQISQVIHNMIINADQSMPQGGIIDIRCENVDVSETDYLPLKRGQYIKISIADHGVGITKENIAKIFDPYFTTKKKGSGLGLTTSYSIIKRHEGHIAVESEPGVGTTFEIYLPASGKESPKTESTCSEGTLCTGKGRILLMDDEEFIRQVAGEMLGYLGYEVEFASNGEETIDLYKRARESGHTFDAVIMDLTIPGGMGGRDAVRKLIEIDPNVRAIASSGYSNDPVMADYRGYGFCGVVIKPYKADELGNAVHSVLKIAQT